jgi:hypothetical protein
MPGEHTEELFWYSIKRWVKKIYRKVQVKTYARLNSAVYKNIFNSLLPYPFKPAGCAPVSVEK